MSVVIPAGMIHNRVETDSVDIHSSRKRGSDFVTNVGEPTRTLLILSPCLRYEQRAGVPVMHFCDDVSERSISRLATSYGVAAVPPLVPVVVIDSQNIEISLIAAKLRVCPSRNHVPRLEHRKPVFLGLLDILRASGIADDMVHGFWRHQSDVGNVLEDHPCGARIGPDKLPLQFRPAASLEGIDCVCIAAGPGEKGNFVDWRNEQGTSAVASQERDERPREYDEGINPFGGKNVETIRLSEVKQVPYDLDVVL